MTFRYLTAGESHGKCLTAIVEGIPAGIEVDLDDINKHLARRQQGYGRGGRMKIEKDKVSVHSGIRHGLTTGAPITLVVENKDWTNWTVPMAVESVDMSDNNVAALVSEKKITHVRPGHADLPGAIKYNQNDVRNILERSSARETAIRVAVGALASIVLEKFGINIVSHILQIGTAKINRENLPDSFSEIKKLSEASEVRCADKRAEDAIKNEINKAGEQGDTLGGVFELIAENVPVGLGSHVHWDKRLDAKIAQAVMSIQAIKSVNIGLGEEVGMLPGSLVHDEILTEKYNHTYKRQTNNAGGIEGGISNGMPIVVRAAMKPIPTLKKPLKSINLETGEEHVAHYERSDVCASPAACVVGEAMLATVLLEAFLEKFGGDSFQELKTNFENYIELIEKR